MSWHCSQALVEASSAARYLDGGLSARLKSIRTAEKCRFDDRKTPSSRRSRSGMTCELSPSETTSAAHSFGHYVRSVANSSSRPDSPASPSASPANDTARTTNGTCGRTRSESFAKYDRASHCWRTSQASFQHRTGEPFSGTWPRAGLMRSGACCRQPSAERRIGEIGYGYSRMTGTLWPTPSACDGQQGGTIKEDRIQALRETGKPKKRMDGGEYQTKLAELVVARMWPTPNKWDARRGPDARDRPESGGPNLLAAVQMWPSPRATDGSKGGPNQRGSKGDLTLPSAAAQWPTPTRDRWDGLQSHGVNAISGQLNPTWVEWLMGWPLGWTDLRPLGMDRFQLWLQQHGGC